MKKILALLLVLGFAATANATVLDVVAVNIWVGGSSSNKIPNPTQAQLDAVGVGDRVNLKVVLNDNGTPVTYNNPYAYSVNGYFLSGLSADVRVTGPGTLATAGLGFHSALSLTGHDSVSGNEIANISGAGPFGEEGKTPAGIPGGVMVESEGAPYDQISTPRIFNLFNVTVTALGIIDVNLTNADIAGQWREGDTGAWGNFVEDDYGDLTFGVPEPMTIALLGLGGLGLVYRRRRV